MRIALLSDTHLSFDPRYLAHADHLTRAIAEVNSENVDVVLIAGDLTHEGHVDEIDAFRSQIRGLNAPVYYVYGNHDVGGKKLDGTPGEITPELLARLETTLGPSFWSQTVGDTSLRLRIIGINASLLGSGLPEEPVQWGFLQRELSQESPPPTIILMHYPPYVNDPDEAGGVYWNLEKTPRAEFLSAISEPTANVKAILCGHLHYPMDRYHKSIRIINAPTVAFGIPAGKQPEGWLLLTLSESAEITSEFHLIAGSL